MTVDPGGMTARKRRHIDVCLTDAVGYHGVTTGLERYRLPYNALTQTRLEDVDLVADRLRRASWPVLRPEATDQRVGQRIPDSPTFHSGNRHRPAQIRHSCWHCGPAVTRGAGR